VAVLADFACGANEAGFHLTGTNFGRDLPDTASVHDLRNVVEGDPSPDGAGTLELCRGIEVGHIFQLRTRYSQAMKVEFIDEAGQPKPMEMGCYGIGVSRIVGAAIEQGFDERGIVFPAAIAPFQVAIAPIGLHKSEAVRTAAESLYAALQAAGIDVLLDDRDERPGAMFADMELIGVPHRIVIGERGLAKGECEYKGRRDSQPSMIPIEGAVALIAGKLGR
jgi:prolyl-tRNA synthetase